VTGKGKKGMVKWKEKERKDGKWGRRKRAKEERVTSKEG